MKKIFLIINLFSVFAIYAQLDPGGVSVDLGKVHSENSVLVKQKNYIKSGDFEDPSINFSLKAPGDWQCGVRIHSKIKTDESLLPEITKLMKREIIPSQDNPGNHLLKLLSPLEIQKLRRSDGTPMVSNKLVQTVILLEPLKNPTKFRISIMTKGKRYDAPGLNAFVLLINFFSGERARDSSPLGKMLNLRFTVTDNFERSSLEFTAPKNTRSLMLNFSLYGVGEWFIDDITLDEAALDEGATVRIAPLYFFDNIYHLAEGQVGTLSFGVRNNSLLTLKAPKLHVKLPPGFACVDNNEKTPLIEKKTAPDSSQSVVLDLTGQKSFVNQVDYDVRRPASILIRSSLPGGEKLYPVEYHITDGAYTSHVVVTNIKIVPALAPVKTPKIFRSGLMLRSDFNFAGDGAKPFVDFYKNNGFNSIHGSRPPLFNAALVSAKIERYIQPSNLCNGYRLGTPPIPPEAQFINEKGQAITDNGMPVVCPTAVYTRSAYFEKSIAGLVEDILIKQNISDQIMPNWELYYLAHRGCFCSACQMEFSKYAKVPREDIAKVWKEDIINTPLGEKWVKFRSWQHGLLMVTLKDTVKAAGARHNRDTNFIPEIGWTAFLPSRNHAFNLYNPIDFMGSFEWLDPWGPYIFQDYTKKREYYPGLHLITEVAAREIKDFVAKNTRGMKTPKLIAMPHGIQGSTWVTEPEAIAFEMLTFFLNKWEGSIVYYFGGGYDYRYFSALAKANNTIAQTEEIVFNGTVNNHAKITPLTPLPKTSFPDYWNEGGNFKQDLPTLTKEPIIQVHSFNQNQKRLIAVGNFWAKGEAFVTLQVDGLEPKSQYVIKRLCSNDYYLPDSKRNHFTGAELAKGIIVHIGALRWEFLELVPGSEINGTGITQAEVKKELDARIPGISQAAEAEK